MTCIGKDLRVQLEVLCLSGMDLGRLQRSGLVSSCGHSSVVVHETGAKVNRSIELPIVVGVMHYIAAQKIEHQTQLAN